MPLGQRSGSGLFEYVAVVEMALVVEVGIDRGMDGGEFLQGLDVSETMIKFRTQITTLTY